MRETIKILCGKKKLKTKDLNFLSGEMDSIIKKYLGEYESILPMVKLGNNKAIRRKRRN